MYFESNAVYSIFTDWNSMHNTGDEGLFAMDFHEDRGRRRMRKRKVQRAFQDIETEGPSLY